MKYLIASILFILTFSMASAQKQELVVKSTIVCQMCKETIEDGLAYTDGIKSARVDVDANEITIKYKANQISETEVKKAITDLGYAAGDMPANKEAYDKLDGCCKSGGGCD
ncbi:heavy-metal-associated domain-containing protein [Cryomorpha ignava]|uniref:Heavy-metal-associated domain-containing protein n=1 Tax=Cryomorpha ignava TaxID=101383 RepID=A0A7K3WLP9_9FLAO|nr:heavy metal-associated domain-containing protein [Cryomorpha ignava]NEN21961.1 heavy-metal-associated domain-containing protein [Cryomorpha ignava]